MHLVRLQELRHPETDGDRVRLHLGSWSATMPVDRAAAGELRVPSAVFRQHPFLTPGQTIGLWATPTGRDLHLGPLVGIIWDGPGGGQRLGKPVQAEYYETAQHLVAGARAAGVVPFFCSIFSVNLARKTMIGQLPASGPAWQPHTVPLPDVFYNRGTYRDLGKRKQAARMRRHLQGTLGIPQVNSVAGFRKWGTYQALRFFPQTRHLMPETVVIHTKRPLSSFVNRHRRVFLKADGSSWGRDVMKIDTTGDRPRGYRVSGYRAGRPLRKKGALIKPLLGHLTSGGPKDVWLLQRAIDRYKLKDRVFDLRIVMQKDEHGLWQIPHILVNWAHRGEMVANHPLRSDFMTAAQFLPLWGRHGREFTAMIDKAKGVSPLIAAALESRYGMLGELGLDLGIDQTGRPWLFEANAKPFFFPGEGNRYPFLYARYLAQTAWSARYESRPAALPPAPPVPVPTRIPS